MSGEVEKLFIEEIEEKKGRRIRVLLGKLVVFGEGCVCSEEIEPHTEEYYRDGWVVASVGTMHT